MATVVEGMCGCTLNLGLGDGSGRLINIRAFTSSGTYVPTPGTKKIRVRIIGGGGAGSVTTYSNGTSATAGGHGARGEVIVGEYA